MARDWLIIATVIAVLWAMWLFLGYVFDLFHAYWEARARAEATQANQGTES